MLEKLESAQRLNEFLFSSILRKIEFSALNKLLFILDYLIDAKIGSMTLCRPIPSLVILWIIRITPSRGGGTL